MITYADWRETKSFELEQDAFKQMNDLWYQLHEARLRPIGETYHQRYAIFHYIERSQNLIRVLGAILRRMTSDQIDYQKLSRKEFDQMIKASQTGEQLVYTADETSFRFLEFLIADFESLYQIGHTLLDEWALIVSHVAALASPRQINFNKLFTNFLAPSTTSPENASEPATLCSWLSRDTFDQINWLHSHILIFRDKFLVHQTSPYLLSTIADPITGDLCLSYNISPVWYGEEATQLLHQQIWEVNAVAPENIRLDPTVYANPHFVLAQLFVNIDMFDRHVRDKLHKVAQDGGFTTPTSTQLVHRIFNFITATVAIIKQFAAFNVDTIKLGVKTN